MTIISKSEGLNGKDLYKMSAPTAHTRRMQELVGTEVVVFAWVLYEREDSRTGELKRVLAIKTGDGIFATVSKAFIEGFGAVVEAGLEHEHIMVMQGTAKNGRNYIYCDLA